MHRDLGSSATGATANPIRCQQGLKEAGAECAQQGRPPDQIGKATHATPNTHPPTPTRHPQHPPGTYLAPPAHTHMGFTLLSLNQQVPFPTGRPTMKEISEIYARLAAVYLHAGPPATVAPNGDGADGEASPAPAQPPKPSPQEVVPEADKVVVADAEFSDSLLYTAASTATADDLRGLLGRLAPEDSHGMSFAPQLAHVWCPAHT